MNYFYEKKYAPGSKRVRQLKDRFDRTARLLPTDTSELEEGEIGLDDMVSDKYKSSASEDETQDEIFDLATGLP